MANSDIKPSEILTERIDEKRILKINRGFKIAYQIDSEENERMFSAFSFYGIKRQE